MHFTSTSVWCPTGFKMTVNRHATRNVKDYRILVIEDLNPQQEIRLVVTRWEALRIAAHIIRRAFLPRAA